MVAMLVESRSAAGILIDIFTVFNLTLTGLAHELTRRLHIARRTNT